MDASKKEEQLVHRFRQGDTAALQIVFKKFYSPLCYFATRLVNDREEAEEITLDSFNKIWVRRTDFDNLANIKAFLYITTRNACYNYITARNRKTEKVKQAGYVLNSDNGKQEGVDYEMIRAEVMQEIFNQVEILPPKCRQVFIYIFKDGLSTAEISERMQISDKTVLNQKQKAVKLIKQELLKRKLYTTIILLDILLNYYDSMPLPATR